ncbi:LapA family protein [Nucisporomicrobium flavum]|uniref:LapA family protein n=1 Tax=Nucisporomicrobium flavum TaxID=2785915 RepID=UPI0018F2E2AA|nr:LapA family protein [Nucisporomicrobium flavum]
MAYPSEQWPVPHADPDRTTDAAPPLPDELAQTLAGLGPAGEAPARRAGNRRPGAGAARPAVWAGAVALLVVIVFVAQNTGGVDIAFLWMHGRVSLALALIVAGIAGAVIGRALAVALRRLRRPARRR